MAVNANNIDTLNGFHKSIYGEELVDLIPEGVKLTKMIPFVKPNKRMGFDYKQPVSLQLEHGVTYGGTEGAAFSLNDAIPGATREASIKGCEMVLRGQVSIGAISRSINDAASYGRATKHVIKNLLISTHKKQEQMMFYGQSGIAKIATDVEAVANGLVSAVEYNAGTTRTEVLIEAASFAPGIFAGGEGMKLDFTASLAVAPVVLGKSIVKVDVRSKVLYFAGDQTASIVAEQFIFEGGAYGNECLGIEAMLSETSANVFGISTADYSLWNGNVYNLVTDGGESSAAPLSFDHVSKSIADAVSKGLEGKLDLFVNPKTWSDLLSEQTAQRQFDSRYDTKKYENGAMSIVFYSQNGMIEIHSSTYVKEGIAFGLDLGCFERVGSSDVTFKIPGTNEDYMIKLQDYHALEYRTYCDLAIFCTALGHNLLITGISNS